ncbi:hypothetical protein VTP01DRAFT_9884 [Rhizomucor pusillus]|uniref:uncharacterized protein n=1 Tax=Rhizomucor pusillus TaxID=4840 RepID=UPI00374469CA
MAKQGRSSISKDSSVDGRSMTSPPDQRPTFKTRVFLYSCSGEILRTAKGSKVQGWRERLRSRLVEASEYGHVGAWSLTMEVIQAHYDLGRPVVGWMSLCLSNFYVDIHVLDVEKIPRRLPPSRTSGKISPDATAPKRHPMDYRPNAF